MFCSFVLRTFCVRAGQAEAHQLGCDLANMHEARDRALLELERLEEVQGLILQRQGINRYQVGTISLCLTNTKGETALGFRV